MISDKRVLLVLNDILYSTRSEIKILSILEQCSRQSLSVKLGMFNGKIRQIDR